MKTEDIVLKYLQSDKCREEKYLPKEFFSVTVGFFELLESLENAEVDIRLGIIESWIVSFCLLNDDILFLHPYIKLLEDFWASDFSMKKMKQCEVLFESMRDVYVKKYINRGVILLEGN